MAEDELLRRIVALEERVRQLEAARESEAVEQPRQTVAPPQEQTEPAKQQAAEQAHPTPASEPSPPKALARKRNWEALIGGSVLNRVGILAVLIGSAYFLRHAFEQGWIGPPLRVAIGLVIGLALLVWAEVLRRKGARIFAHSIDVLSIGVLYLSIWAATRLYDLIPMGFGFGAMVAITGITVALAVRHDSEFLAGLGMTAGFLAPALLLTIDGPAIELFSYVLLLDIAALGLLAVRPWVRLFAVNFWGTLLLYVAWYAQEYSDERFVVALGFATAFFLAFVVVPLMRSWRGISQLSLAVLALLPVGNAIVYFAEISILMEDERPLLVAWTAGLGVLYLLIFGGLTRRLHEEHRTLAGLHLGIGLGFFLLTIPLQFDGSAVTVGWLVVAAILFAVRSRLEHVALSAAGGIAMTLAVFRLLFLDEFAAGIFLVNLRVFSFGIAVALFAWFAHRARLRGDQALRRLSILMANLLAVVGLSREVGELFATRSLARDFSYSALWLLYASGMMVVGFRRSSAFTRWLGLILLGVTVVKVFLYDLSELEAIYRIGSFIALGVVLLAVSFVYQKVSAESEE